jgi:hypothetical protein
MVSSIGLGPVLDHDSATHGRTANVVFGLVGSVVLRAAVRDPPAVVPDVSRGAAGLPVLLHTRGNLVPGIAPRVQRAFVISKSELTNGLLLQPSWALGSTF